MRTDNGFINCQVRLDSGFCCFLVVFARVCVRGWDEGALSGIGMNINLLLQIVERTATDLAKLRECAGPTGPSVLAYGVNIKLYMLDYSRPLEDRQL